MDGVLADSHLASPIMDNHCLDHLLSACLYVMRRPEGVATDYSAIFSAALTRPDGNKREQCAGDHDETARGRTKSSGPALSFLRVKSDQAVS